MTGLTSQGCTLHKTAGAVLDALVAGRVHLGCSSLQMRPSPERVRDWLLSHSAITHVHCVRIENFLLWQQEGGD